jgi:hypothetical protein
MFGKKPRIEISEDWVIQQLMKIPHGVLVGMFIETSNHLCNKERIDPGLYYHLLFDHEPLAKYQIIGDKPE